MAMTSLQRTSGRTVKYITVLRNEHFKITSPPTKAYHLPAIGNKTLVQNGLKLPLKR
jgi:hypothetical protein